MKLKDMQFFITGLGNLFENKDHIIKKVVEADKWGFDAALMPDHYMWGSEIGHSMHNPYKTLETWTTFTYLAGKTERIKFGTLVTPLPFRHPGVLAKRLSTLDNLSGGRVILGVGAGWSRVEFEGYSNWLGDKSRVDKTIQALSIIRRLWTEDSVTYRSEHYNLKDAVLDPKPIQKPHPPLLFGSSGKRMLKLTGKYGNICFIPPWMTEKKQEIKKTVIQSAQEAGRADKIGFMAGMMGAGAYNQDIYTKAVEDAEKDGAKYFAVAFPRSDLKNSMADFAENVMPSYH
jgi:alkanesulfonate monooxygenase SsuD/methylene tetrahydromethanopterin reductase-like flavin-dependent oxidoreductase (luciferase family)